jgi:hypothetical protein
MAVAKIRVATDEVTNSMTRQAELYIASTQHQCRYPALEENHGAQATQPIAANRRWWFASNRIDSSSAASIECAWRNAYAEHTADARCACPCRIHESLRQIRNIDCINIIVPSEIELRTIQCCAQ